jgi:hypothetical protein
MTESLIGRSAGEPGSAPRCGWCRRALAVRAGPGRPAKFCSQKCRQWNWVAQQRSAELQLSEHELVIVRSELDALHDDLYVLACAVDDTERDLAEGGHSVADLRSVIDWLLAAARPLRDHELRPGGAPTKSS